MIPGMTPSQPSFDASRPFVVSHVLVRGGRAAYPGALAMVFSLMRVSPQQPGDGASVAGIAWAAFVFGTILTGGFLWLRYVQAKQSARKAGLEFKACWRPPPPSEGDYLRPPDSPPDP